MSIGKNLVSTFSAVFSPEGVTLGAAKGIPARTLSHTNFLKAYQTIFNSKIEEEAIESASVCTELPVSVISMSHTKTHLHLVLYYPEKVVPVIQFDARDDGMIEYKDVCLPNVLIYVYMKKMAKSPRDDIQYVMENAYYYATDRSPEYIPATFLKDRTSAHHIWKLPLPNIYSSGAMCFGDNSIISNYGHNLKPLNSLYQVIYDSPFNNDLSIQSVEESVSCRQWLRTLSRAETFPYEKLSGFSQSRHEEHTSNYVYR